MRRSKQMLKPIFTGHAPKERFSTRVQNGVEIYEHEFIQTRRISNPSSGSDEYYGEPRLIIEAAPSSQMITRSRSEVFGLAGLLELLKAEAV